MELYRLKCWTHRQHRAYCLHRRYQRRRNYKAAHVYIIRLEKEVVFSQL